ncbi:MAG: sodium:solute symporter [Bacteroidota bacterium]|nr:sodium:solute symporter [Bacteroidota bacterium]
MSPVIIISCVIAYSVLLFLITWFTAKKTDNDTFFLGNKISPWYVVAYGMIGASLSGVTFMSVPGWVGDTNFSYLMVIFGYLFGYFVIALVLMPLYYRLNLTSIYSYLENRFGFRSYKTGAFYFLLSRTIGASFRMFIVVNVLQTFVFDKWGMPFWIVVAIFLSLVLLFTFRGGIRTIIWTDTLQTTFMLLAVMLSIYIISHDMGIGLSGLLSKVKESHLSKVFFMNWQDKRFFIKQFFSGMFITIVMTGLDQEMMQKNLSCKNIREAQKNMFTFSFILVIVNAMFLFLGAILFLYAISKGVNLPKSSDNIFPTIALNYLGPVAGFVFILGLISAAYPSADGALTSLTTSFCVDFLNMNKNDKISNKKKVHIRYAVHISFAILLLLIIVIFKIINNQAVISKLFTVAGYTYGPLLGLYSFGLFTNLKVKDKYVPLICIISPILCYFFDDYSKIIFNGYEFGFELLILNGLLTFLGLLLISKKRIESF